MIRRAPWLALALLVVGCSRAPLPLDRPTPPDAAPTPPSAAPPDAACDPNACGDCGRPLPEECNGRDDDCDGVVDEGCPRRLLEAPAPWSSAYGVRLVGPRAIVTRSGVMTLVDVTTGQPLLERRARGAALGDRLTAWLEPVADDGNRSRLVLRDHGSGQERTLPVDGYAFQLDTWGDDVVYAINGRVMRVHDGAAPTTLLTGLSPAQTTTLRLAGPWAVAILGDQSTRVVALDLATGAQRTLWETTPATSARALVTTDGIATWMVDFPGAVTARYEARLASGAVGGTGREPLVALSGALELRLDGQRLTAVDRLTGQARLVASSVAAADVEDRRVLYATTTGELWLVEVE